MTCAVHITTTTTAGAAGEFRTVLPFMSTSNPGPSRLSGPRSIVGRERLASQRRSQLSETDGDRVYETNVAKERNPPTDCLIQGNPVRSVSQAGEQNSVCRSAAVYLSVSEGGTRYPRSVPWGKASRVSLKRTTQNTQVCGVNGVKTRDATPLACTLTW